MTDPLFIDRGGHRTWLKWHRARRRGSDPVFTGTRIVQAMRLGASVEVDLTTHRGGGFAVLHDPELGHETTGRGRIADKTAAELRAEVMRDNDGQPTTEPVRLLADLAGLLAGGVIHPDALLQLDYKEDAAALNARTLANFAESVAPIARNAVVSSGDAAAVEMLTAVAPAIRVGYDPCHGDALTRLAASRDFTGFVADAVAASPRAEIVYLAYELVLSTGDFDIVAAFHEAGRRVDAYTIKSADDASRPLLLALLDRRVDQITTDDPEGVAALLA